MLKIGLTGGIGSGKSTVAKVFETLGIPVYYSDEASKRLMNQDPDLKRALLETFGTDTYRDGTLNRSYLASVVFSDKEKLSRLNALVHPATILDGERWMDRQQGPYAVKESSLLFEAGIQGQFDKIVGVSAPDPLRIKRVMDRDGITADEVRKRMRNQIQVSIKMLLCDSVIVNDDLLPVIPQVLALDRQFRKGR